MSFLDKLERKFFKYSIPGITLPLIIGQVLYFGLLKAGVLSLENISLIGREVLSGQYLRIVSFLLIPITDSLIFAVFTWLLYYTFGTALESEWGTFRYNLYILLSYIFTVMLAFIFPDVQLTNTYLYASIFLAFAYLYPNFEIRLFFILPIKIKWLALIQWISYAFMLILGTWANRFLLIVSIGNFLLFFGKDAVLRLTHRNRRTSYKKKITQDNEKPFHTCSVCGLTDKQDPKMSFRYCPDCDAKCYCMDHLDGHECVKS